MQVEESARLLYHMLTKPNAANLNAKRFSAALVFEMAYGRRLSEDDADLKEVLGILDNFIADCYPGTHIVDVSVSFCRLPFQTKTLARRSLCSIIGGYRALSRRGVPMEEQNTIVKLR